MRIDAPPSVIVAGRRPSPRTQYRHQLTRQFELGVPLKDNVCFGSLADVLRPVPECPLSGVKRTYLGAPIHQFLFIIRLIEAAPEHSGFQQRRPAKSKGTVATIRRSLGPGCP